MENLSNEQLICLIHEGDDIAKEYFVIKNSPLVYSIIKRYANKRVSYEDLFQIGCIGLMKALNNFDTSFNVKFSTYAVPIILGEIKRFFRDDGSIRISRSLKEGFVSIIKEKELLSQVLNREPTYNEIAEALSLDVNDVILSFEANQFVYSLDEPIYESDGSSFNLEDKIVCENDDIALRLSLHSEVSKLEAKEKLLLYYRYDLCLKQDDIAKRLNISQVQVSRLEKKIIFKLKNQL
ncbi:MAG: sigma-70 family RNA polymerase sigma factor, partial [Erysipelotrichaceae bacterium]